jgi:hypothetical protein
MAPYSKHGTLLTVIWDSRFGYFHPCYLQLVDESSRDDNRKDVSDGTRRTNRASCLGQGLALIFGAGTTDRHHWRDFFLILARTFTTNVKTREKLPSWR